MALQRFLADGTEPPCPKCGGRFVAHSFKIKRPSSKPGRRDTFTVGGSAHMWVHEKCSPTKVNSHAWSR